MSVLQISIQFLQGTFHGRSDNAKPEWPVSPLRLYQALVAVAAARHGMPLPAEVAATLDWLASQGPPEIYAPPSAKGQPVKTSVPNNAMDIVAKAWSRGNETSKDAQMSTHKAMKEIRPQWLLPATDQTWKSASLEDWCVHFCWQVPASDIDAVEGHLQILADLARHLYCVGWGLDVVTGQAILQTKIPSLKGECWQPCDSGGNKSRTPRPRARQMLEQRHTAFTNRLSGRTLNSAASLSPAAYDIIHYRRTTDPVPPQWVAFSLLPVNTQPDDDDKQSRQNGFRAFSKLKGMHVAGMLRHAVAEAARHAGWPVHEINQFVLGHGESKGEAHQPVGSARLSYIPLPSLQIRSRNGRADHVSAIRRVLISTTSTEHAARLESLRRIISGVELIDEEKNSQALLATLTHSDKMVQRYCRPNPAATWATVTPVILPGFDRRKRDGLHKTSADATARKNQLNHLHARTEALLRKAIRQAGYSEELAAHAKIEWRSVGYWPGAEIASRYFVPAHLKKFPRYHVRITWRTASGQALPIHGPIVIGGGRYNGHGLFAAIND